MGPRPHLTRRERQVAAGIKRGCSNREIAERLGLKPQTIKNYVTCIYEKLGVANRTQLAVLLTTRRTNRAVADLRGPLRRLQRDDNG